MKKKYKNDRSVIISRLAHKLWMDLEPTLNNISNQLENSMEINHFLACFSNLTAIQFELKMGSDISKKEKDI